jgi:hypothetical protein
MLPWPSRRGPWPLALDGSKRRLPLILPMPFGLLNGHALRACRDSY